MMKKLIKVNLALLIALILRGAQPAYALTITNISQWVGQTTSTITWQTDNSAYGQIEYGLTSEYGSTDIQTFAGAVSSGTSPTLTAYHRHTLFGLTSGVLYHYRVMSKTSAGSPVYSQDRTFTTLGEGPNLIANGGFEGGAIAWEFPFEGSIDTTTYYFGTKSAKIQRTTQGSSTITTNPSILIAGGKIYRIRCYYRLFNVIASQGNGVRISISWYKANGNLVRSDTLIPGKTGMTSWISSNNLITAPTDAIGFRLRLQLINATGRVNFDDITVKEQVGGN